MCAVSVTFPQKILTSQQVRFDAQLLMLLFAKIIMQSANSNNSINQDLSLREKRSFK
jgi:hypothetical protein